MNKNYKTAQGKTLNMEKLRLLNELTPAIGNMNVNARGDLISTNGKIIKTRNEVMKDKRSKNHE
jgi:hypothetical protein